MKKYTLLAAMALALCGPAFAATPTTQTLLVYSDRYAFQGVEDILLPATEAVSDYMESLAKGGPIRPRAYSCEVKGAQGVGTASPNDGIIVVDMLYDVRNCTAR